MEIVEEVKAQCSNDPEYRDFDDEDPTQYVKVCGPEGNESPVEFELMREQRGYCSDGVTSTKASCLFTQTWTPGVCSVSPCERGEQAVKVFRTWHLAFRTSRFTVCISHFTFHMYVFLFFSNPIFSLGLPRDTHERRAVPPASKMDGAEL